MRGDRLQFVFLILVSFVALAGLLAQLSAIYPAYGEICEAAQQGQQKQCTTYSFAPFLFIKVAKSLDAMSSAITAIATAVVSWFTYTLWRATDQQRRISEQQKDAGRLQMLDSRAIQRAYLAVDGGGIDPLDSASVAHIVVRNVGHLPARNVRWFIKAEPSAEGSRPNFPIDESKLYGDNVISPGVEMLRSQNFLMMPDWSAAFARGEAHIYVWGEVRYLDGFGSPRFTRFCHRYGRRGIKQRLTNFQHTTAQSVIGESVSAESMRYHRFGNDAD